MKTRIEIAHSEATRDPIFLFQRRDYALIKELPYGPTTEYPFYYDGEEIVYWDSGLDYDAGDQVDWQTLKEFEFAFEYWVTESVWGTREEAEQFGKVKNYNYRNGWRVYCVCCEGTLADHLNVTFLKEATNA